MSTTIDIFRNVDYGVQVPAGTVIFSEGDPGDQAYVVQHGKVEIQVKGRTLEILEEGGIFGEMALIDNEARSATVIAQTDATIVPIDRHRFMFLVQQTPNFAVKVMQVMSARLRAIHEMTI
ncbi:MAG: cyclic nucleotide-binding domain-containing protein [bacterium]|nr:cyclic nucleotide-binding domain-containing protein [bacterium]